MYIKIKRGNKKDCPLLKKDELVYFKDTNEIAIGLKNGNYQIVGFANGVIPICYAE